MPGGQRVSGSRVLRRVVGDVLEDHPGGTVREAATLGTGADVVGGNGDRAVLVVGNAGAEPLRLVRCREPGEVGVGDVLRVSLYLLKGRENSDCCSK